MTNEFSGGKFRDFDDERIENYNSQSIMHHSSVHMKVIHSAFLLPLLSYDIAVKF